MYRLYRTIATLKKKSVQYPRFVPNTTQSKLYINNHKIKNNSNNHKLLKFILYTSIRTSAIVGYTISKNIDKVK